MNASSGMGMVGAIIEGKEGQMGAAAVEEETAEEAAE